MIDDVFPRSDDDHGPFRAELERRLSGPDETPLAELLTGPLGREEARQATDRLMAEFRAAGFTPGDRIALFCRDERSLVLLVLAALRAGIGFVVGDPKSSPEEASVLAAVCRPAAVLAEAELLGAKGIGQALGDVPVLPLGAGPSLPAGWSGRSGAAPSPGTAMLIFTSGTTSVAKAVQLGYGTLRAQLDIFAEAYGFGAGLRLLNLLPLHHTDGLTRGPIAAAWFGGTLCRPVAFSVQSVPQILDWVAAEGATHFVTVPAMLRIVERLARDRPAAFRTPDFRFVLSSADALDAGLWQRAEATLGVPVVNAYGLSEAVCDALFAGPDAASRIPGTIGRPVGLAARVVDPDGAAVADGLIGELTLKGPTVMGGYFGAPEATAEILRDGVLRTGDLVMRRADGLFEFVGRRKSAIVSGGVTIYPEGVTAVLAGLPGVAEAHAFGVRDPERGERLVAAVVPVEGRSLSVPEIWALCRGRLSPERVPQEIRILDRLPRTESGKVIVADLVRAASEGPAGPAGPASVYAVAADVLRLPEAELTADSSPFNTPGWDSLTHMTLITEIEEAFGIMLSAEDIVTFMSLGDMVAIVDRIRASP